MGGGPTRRVGDQPGVRKVTTGLTDTGILVITFLTPLRSFLLFRHVYWGGGPGWSTKGIGSIFRNFHQWRKALSEVQVRVR